jgi:hypothetical protein
MNLKAQATKVKVDKWDNIKLKSFWTSTETTNKTRRPFMEWEEISVNHTKL